MPIIPVPAGGPKQIENAAVGPCQAIEYSDLGGLTQFGAFVEILPPGSKSSLKHWHANEDELVYMLTGEVILHEGETETPFRAGQCATFKAGVAVGHCLENRSDGDATYLVVGTRSGADTVTYPDHDCILTYDRASDTRSYRTFDGKPRESAYKTT